MQTQMTLFALAAITFFTSIVSGVIGMGGGVLLLSAMTFFLPLQTIIPVHGLVQLASNSSRLLYLRAHIRWSYFYFFVVGLPFGAATAALLLKGLVSEAAPYLFISLLIFYAVFKPKKTPHFSVKGPGWILVGFFTGVAGILAGAVGPLIAPFFIRDDLRKEEIVATKASMQMITHFSKIPAFLYLGFNFDEQAMLICLMCVAAVAGTHWGVKILKNVDEGLFRKLYKGVLLVSGARLLYKFLEYYF